MKYPLPPYSIKELNLPETERLKWVVQKLNSAQMQQMIIDFYNAVEAELAQIDRKNTELNMNNARLQEVVELQHKRIIELIARVNHFKMISDFWAQKSLHPQTGSETIIDTILNKKSTCHLN